MIQILAIATALALLTTAFPGQKEFGAQAKVTIQQARQIALHAFPGKIVTEELEKEKGGSGLRYSFAIKGSAGLREIGVDAASGKVLEDATEKGND